MLKGYGKNAPFQWPVITRSDVDGLTRSLTPGFAIVKICDGKFQIEKTGVDAASFMINWLLNTIDNERENDACELASTMKVIGNRANGHVFVEFGSAYINAQVKVPIGLYDEHNRKKWIADNSCDDLPEEFDKAIALPPFGLTTDDILCVFGMIDHPRSIFERQ